MWHIKYPWTIKPSPQIKRIQEPFSLGIQYSEGIIQVEIKASINHINLLLLKVTIEDQLLFEGFN